MQALGILIVGFLLVALFLALSAMFIAAAPYLAIVVIIALIGWLASKAPEPERGTKQAPPRWPHDPNDFR